MHRLRVADYFKVPGLPVAVVVIGNQTPLGLHCHEFAELTIILGGAASHITAQGRYPIAAGDVFYVPPERPHGFADTRGLRLVNILFLPRRMPEVAGEVRGMAGWQALFESEPRYRDAQGFAGHLRLPPEELERVTALARELEEETRTRAAGGIALVEALFTQLAVRLARSYGAHASPAGRRLLAVQKAPATSRRTTRTRWEWRPWRVWPACRRARSSGRFARRRARRRSSICCRCGWRGPATCCAIRTGR